MKLPRNITKLKMMILNEQVQKYIINANYNILISQFNELQENYDKLSIAALSM